jgi:hypothetical protein
MWANGNSLWCSGSCSTLYWMSTASLHQLYPLSVALYSCRYSHLCYVGSTYTVRILQLLLCSIFIQILRFIFIDMVFLMLNWTMEVNSCVYVVYWQSSLILFLIHYKYLSWTTNRWQEDLFSLILSYLSYSKTSYFLYVLEKVIYCTFSWREEFNKNISASG